MSLQAKAPKAEEEGREGGAHVYAYGCLCKVVLRLTLRSASLTCTVEAAADDSFADKLWIWIFAIKMVKQLPDKDIRAEFGWGYSDYVELSKQLLRGDPDATKQSVLNVLRG
jgi:hypothetical protein